MVNHTQNLIVGTMATRENVALCCQITGHAFIWYALAFSFVLELRSGMQWCENMLPGIKNYVKSFLSVSLSILFMPRRAKLK